MSRSVKKEPVYPKLALGISLLLIGFVFISGKFKPESIYTTSFQSEPVQVSGFTALEASKDDIPVRIIIPEIAVDVSVKPAKLVGGYWEVFEDSAGWGEGSGLPGEAGNQVIFAHARKGLFHPLRLIKSGSVIYILSGSKYYSYEVTEIKEVQPGQVEVIAPTAEESLTLYTCSGFADSKRLIVIAKPRKI